MRPPSGVWKKPVGVGDTARGIRALDPLAARQKFSVVFLGSFAKDNPYGQEFQQLFATRPWCRFGGFASREQLKQHLRDATLLVLPTLEDNCPMCVLEAMAASVPVVAARVGGVPDLIEDHVTGLFCDPASADSMCGAVERVLADAGLRAPARRGESTGPRAVSSGGHCAAASGNLPRGLAQPFVDALQLAAHLQPGERPGRRGFSGRGVVKCPQTPGGFRGVRSAGAIIRVAGKDAARPGQFAQEQRTTARGGFERREAQAFHGAQQHEAARGAVGFGQFRAVLDRAFITEQSGVGGGQLEKALRGRIIFGVGPADDPERGLRDHRGPGQFQDALALRDDGGADEPRAAGDRRVLEEHRLHPVGVPTCTRSVGA